MGDWIYYISYMKMSEIAKRVSRAQSFYDSEILDEALQRELEGVRAQKIEHYLLSQNQRFFNSLVIGTYGGDPQWTEVKLNDSAKNPIASGEFEGVLGFLTLTGQENLFAIDGQHRVEGIRVTMEHHPELGAEEVPIIIVRGIEKSDRTSDPIGFQRTRRLFSTLNRYAKPVSKKAIITLDEDDAMAIITRRLIEENPLFRGKKLSLSHSSSLPANDMRALTNINTLYEALNTYFITSPKSSWDEFKRFYPGEDKIDELYQSAVALWSTFCKYLDELREIRDSEPDEKVAAKYRRVDGGNILFRPIGLLLYIKIVRLLVDHEKLSLDEAVERVSKIPRDLSKVPWADLLWNTAGKRMLTDSVNRRAAEKMLFHAVGGKLEVLKTDTTQLCKDIAAIKGTEPNTVKLFQIS